MGFRTDLSLKPTNRNNRLKLLSLLLNQRKESRFSQKGRSFSSDFSCY